MIVFVHGVPETDRLWGAIRERIAAPSVALSLPGFGCPRPDGFGATKDDYAAWLVGELEALGEPVDLVGHDWGAALTYRVVTTRSDLLRSWVADNANVVHPVYEWHDFAKTWQTPGEGEAFMEAQNAVPPEQRASIFESMGVPPDDALAMAARDEVMDRSILDLYRSATPNARADWTEGWNDRVAPGLVLHPTDDPFGDETLTAEVAAELGAPVERLERLGHWWAVQSPERAAAVLERFWSST
jgi:pimeloyl-ACP methyl ester carboxylesterase